MHECECECVIEWVSECMHESSLSSPLDLHLCLVFSYCLFLFVLPVV